MRYVYASRLPRIANCPASEVQSDGKPDASKKAARFGGAFHELMELYAKKGEGEALLALPAIALTHGQGVDVMTDAFLSNTHDPSKGSNPEAEVRGDLFTDVDGESDPTKVLGGDKIVGGIIDWRDEIEPGHWLVVDYKTGNPDYQEDAERSLQLLAYGVATMLDKEAERVTVQFYFPKLGDDGWTEPYSFDFDEAAVLHQAIVAMVDHSNAQWDLEPEDRRYSIGEHCTFCPGVLDCPARLAPLQAAYNAISISPVLKKDGTPGKKTKTELLFDVRKDNAVDVLLSVRYAKKAVELLSEKVKELVAKIGPIPTDDGKVLDLRESERAPQLKIEHVVAAMEKAELPEEGQLVVMHELTSMKKTKVQRLDIYKEREE